MAVNFEKLGNVSRANPRLLAENLGKVDSFIKDGKLFPANPQKKDKGKHRSRAFAVFQSIYRDSGLRLLLENYFRCKFWHFVDFCDRGKGTAPLLLHGCIQNALGVSSATADDPIVPVLDSNASATLQAISDAIKAVAEMAFHCRSRRCLIQQLEKNVT